MGSRRYVDVNVFVYWLGDHPIFGERAREWIERIEISRKYTYFTSALTIYETVVILAGLLGRSLRDSEFVEGVIKAFTELETLSVIPLTDQIMVEALRVMGRYGLDYEDSIHLASALAVKASEIISDDKDFDKSPLERTF